LARKCRVGARANAIFRPWRKREDQGDEHETAGRLRPSPRREHGAGCGKRQAPFHANTRNGRYTGGREVYVQTRQQASRPWTGPNGPGVYDVNASARGNGIGCVAAREQGPWPVKTWPHSLSPCRAWAGRWRPSLRPRSRPPASSHGSGCAPRHILGRRAPIHLSRAERVAPSSTVRTEADVGPHSPCGRDEAPRRVVNPVGPIGPRMVNYHGPRHGGAPAVRFHVLGGRESLWLRRTVSTTPIPG